MKFRIAGKEKLLALGVYPEVTLVSARQPRDDACKMISNCVDPSLMKQQVMPSKSKASANSFEIVSREWVLSHMANKSESHRERTLRRFETYLFP